MDIMYDITMDVRLIMSYRKYMNEGKEPNKFVKNAANIGCEVSKGTGKTIETVGNIGAGILKYAAEGFDCVYSVLTMPVTETVKYLFGKAQDGKHLFTRIVAGAATAVTGLIAVGVMTPGLEVYGLLKNSENFVRRFTGAIALPFNQLGDAILIEGDPKGFFDKMSENENQVNETEVFDEYTDEE